MLGMMWQRGRSGSAGGGSGGEGSYPYWRINVTANDGGSFYLLIPEIEFREVSGGVSIISGGTAIASTFISADYEPSKAIDDSTATWWNTAADDGTKGWWGYDFSASVSVEEIAIKSLAASVATADRLRRLPRDFGIQYSEDGLTWTTAWSVSGQTAWAADETRVFTKP